MCGASVAEASLSQQEALEVLQAVNRRGEGEGAGAVGGAALASLTALDLMLKEEAELRSIVTFSSQLDEALGGGVQLGKITELCGAPGVGKTQLWYETLAHSSVHSLTLWVCKVFLFHCFLQQPAGGGGRPGSPLFWRGRRSGGLY